MIEMEDIKKSFKMGESVINVLKGISLYIGQGEFVSIMGPSGSGKSTLSSILGCLSTPSSGSYKINGNNITSLSSRALAKLRNEKIGFIFQDFNLLDGLSALDNVSLPLLYGGVGAKERRNKGRACLKSVGLEAKLNHLPSQLSGGQKQRVAIARALINEPTFLFADEPTGALDKRTGSEIMGLMQRLNLNGHTVVQVTHSPVDANYSKRILYLVDGLLVKDEYVERPTLGTLNSKESAQGIILSRLWRVAQLSSPCSDEDFSSLKTLYQRSTDQEALIECVKAFIRIDRPDAEQVIEELWRREEWAIRAEVIRAFETRKNEQSIPAYLRGLRDENTWVRFLSMSQLKRKWPFELTENTRSLILDKLHDPDERIRASALALIEQWKDSSLFEQILAATQDSDGRVRANALQALQGYLRDASRKEQLLNCLSEHLQDKNNRARANAAMLLHTYSPQDSVDSLCKMLLSDNNLMRASSAWAIGQFPSDQGGELLLELLHSESEELVLGQVIRSLGKLAKNSYPLRTQIERVLGKLEPQEISSPNVVLTSPKEAA